MISFPSKIDVPLRTDDDGAIRIGSTRVLLELVIHAFKRGDTPEGIVQSYPSLRLNQVYAVIAYYLENQDTVEAHLTLVAQESAQIRAEIEANQPDMTVLRARLLRQLEEDSK